MYTVVNCSVQTIYIGLAFLCRIKAVSTSESLISSIRFTSKELGIDTEFKHDTAKDLWELSYSSSETVQMKVGKGFYQLQIAYEDGTEEDKAYIGRLIIKEPEEVEDGV